MHAYKPYGTPNQSMYFTLASISKRTTYDAHGKLLHRWNFYSSINPSKHMESFRMVSEDKGVLYNHFLYWSSGDVYRAGQLLSKEVHDNTSHSTIKYIYNYLRQCVSDAENETNHADHTFHDAKIYAGRIHEIKVVMNNNQSYSQIRSGYNLSGYPETIEEKGDYNTNYKLKYFNGDGKHDIVGKLETGRIQGKIAVKNHYEPNSGMLLGSDKFGQGYH